MPIKFCKKSHAKTQSNYKKEKDIMYVDIKTELKIKLNALQDKGDSEENVKNHITIWMLKMLGYDEEWFDFEYLCRKGKNRHEDIYIKVPGAGGMFVETKKYSRDLTEDDLMQLAEYITSKTDIEWGILTNGRQYFLFNNAIHNYGKVKNDITSKIVMRVEYNPATNRFKNERYLKYFSKQAIYDTAVITYYKAIAEFFAKHVLGGEKSKAQYENTLYTFFDYYATKKGSYQFVGNMEYSPLEEITDVDFIDYLRANNLEKKGIEKTPKAKCSHIATMYDVLEKNGYIRYNRMKNVRERAVYEFEKDSTREDNNANEILTTQQVDIILEQMQNKYKKMVVFVLAAYYGFDRSNILLFLTSSWEIINFPKGIFILNGKKYPLVSILRENLEGLKKEYNERGIRKPKAIYIAKRGDEYTTVGTDTINGIFDEIKKINVDDVSLGLYSPQNVRRAIIIKMYESGCTLEEIAYITDSSVSKILKYIPEELIQKRGERSWKSGKNKHPFKEIFDK